MKVKPVEKGKVKNVLRGPRMVKRLKAPAKKISGSVKTGAKLLVDKEPVKKNVKLQRNTVEKAPLKLQKLDLAENTINQAVKILMDLYSEHKSGAKSTLLNEKDAVFLQVALVKKPEVPDQRRKFVKLQHGLFGDDPEVCLFVKDYIPYDKIQRTPDEKIELTVERYEGILKMHGVKSISTIMPMFQFRTEYDSYELKRKLVDRFDVFLCQSNLLDSDRFFKNVGIAFSKRNKVPISVKFPHDLTKPDPKFADRLLSKINSTWYTLKPHSDTISLRVGNVLQPQEQLIANIEDVLLQLTETSDDGVPGGVANINSVMLKTSRSQTIPLYLNIAPKKPVPVPVLKSVRDEGAGEEGELTTQLGKKVVVMPNGNVFVVDDPDFKPPPGWDSDFEDDGDDDEDEADENPDASDDDEQPATKKKKVSLKESSKKKNKKDNKKHEAEPEASDSEDSEAGDAVAAEQQYLKMMEKRQPVDKNLPAKGSRQRPPKTSKPVGKGNTAAKKVNSPKTNAKKVKSPKTSAKKVKSPKTNAKATIKGKKEKKGTLPDKAAAKAKNATGAQKQTKTEGKIPKKKK